MVSLIKTIRKFQVLAFLLLACVALTQLGCGSSDGIGEVYGTVTIDGQTIENATVSFYPVSGRASVGQTDANGYYKLRYSRDQNGAVVGQHKVTVSTVVYPEVNRGSVDVQTGQAVNASITKKGRDESMPPKYLDRNKTVLSTSVKEGSNEINFNLTLAKEELENMVEVK